jgi:hypothetical protein
MSHYTNVTVIHGSTRIATGATADIVDDAEEGRLWGLGSEQLTRGATYRLTGGSALDWEGKFNGTGEGTATSPFVLTVTDLARHRTTNTAVKSPVDTYLGETVARTLAEAMENAVKAQEQINQIGIVALRQALAIRLSAAAQNELAANGEPPTGGSAAKREPRTEGSAVLTAQAPRGVSATLTAQAPSSDRSMPAAWAQAFAEGIDLIDAATTQHMRDVVAAILMAELAPTTLEQQALFQELLSGNLVAETIAALTSATTTPTILSS